MEPFEALENVVKKDLELVFGAGMTALILISARQKAGVPIIGMDTKDYLNMVKAICEDERVKKMWGEAGVQERYTKWISCL